MLRWRCSPRRSSYLWPGLRPRSRGRTGDVSWSWDTTVVLRLLSRVKKRDPAIIGLAAGGKAFSVNGDDGNLNFDKGIASNVFKGTTELEVSYKGIGAFVRAYGFYDIENEDGTRARTPLSAEALERVGSRAEFRDAFVWAKFDLGPVPVEIRGGWQVINWGESTFIQGGINAINPVDVSALRVPGAELRDALLPVGAVFLSVKPSKNTSLEGFWQYDWANTKIDPVGSYFSTTDLAGAGANKVMLGFGSAPDTIPVGFNIPGNPVGVAVPRVGDRKAGESAAVRRRLPPLRPGPRRHRVRPLLHELPQPPAPHHGPHGNAERPPRQRQLRREREVLPRLPRGHQAPRPQLQRAARQHRRRPAGRGLPPHGRAAAGRRRRDPLRRAHAPPAPAGHSPAGAPPRARGPPRREQPGRGVRLRRGDHRATGSSTRRRSR